MLVGVCLSTGVKLGVNYEYKGKKYTVQRELKMKDPTSRKWLDAVIYKAWHTGEFYCRDKQEFLQKFELCEDC